MTCNTRAGRAMWTLRFPLSVLVALVALVAAGCQSVGQGRTTADIRVEPGRTTRDELYRAVGPPHDIQVRRDGRDVLVYRHVRIQGMRVGVSIFYSPFQMGSSQSATDTILVDLSRNDVVVAVRQLGGKASPGWSLLPWGDGSAD
jgi:hypothetical protein